MSALAPISWVDADPGRVAREREEMKAVAPELIWHDRIELARAPAAGFIGPVPMWSAEREEPEGLRELLEGRHLRVIVAYPEAFPVVPAMIHPIDAEDVSIIPLHHRLRHETHVNGDGTLCQLQRLSDWDPTWTAAVQVAEVPAWWAEYLLFRDERIDALSDKGITVERLRDDEIAAYAR